MKKLENKQNLQLHSFNYEHQTLNTFEIKIVQDLDLSLCKTVDQSMESTQQHRFLENTRLSYEIRNYNCIRPYSRNLERIRDQHCSRFRNQRIKTKTNKQIWNRELTLGALIGGWEEEIEITAKESVKQESVDKSRKGNILSPS